MRSNSRRRGAAVGAALMVLALTAGCSGTTSEKATAEAGTTSPTAPSRDWTQPAIRADLAAAANDADAGPEAEIPVDKRMKDCAADWATFSPVTDAQATTIVDSLRKRQWKATGQRTHDKTGLTSLTKGTWTLQVTHRTPDGNNYLALLALRTSPECDKPAKNIN